MKPLKIVFCLSALTAALFVAEQSVFAEEIVIEGNGSGATTEVQVQQETNTTVSQTNTTEVKNEVQVTADTGNNQVDGNGGETTVTTGEVNTETTVDTTVNEAVVETPCCETENKQQPSRSPGTGRTRPIRLIIPTRNKQTSPLPKPPR